MTRIVNSGQNVDKPDSYAGAGNPTAPGYRAPNGQARTKAPSSLLITNLANTTVVALEDGYRVTKTGGVAATWDAAATSAKINSSSRVRIKNSQVAGIEYRAGISPNPDASIPQVAHATNGSIMVWRNLNNLYILDRFLNQSVQIGSAAAWPYVWIEYNKVDDKVRCYKGATADFAAATLAHTSAALGVGSSWGFDSVLYSLNASFEASFKAI